MPEFDSFAVLGIILVFILLGVLILIPTSKRTRPRRRVQRPQGEDQKDWKGVSLKMEKHIYSLRGEVAALQKKEKKLERELFIQKEKYAKLQDKLAQERGWQKKEETDIEKKTKDILRLKKDLNAAEQSLQKEHGQRLRLERELKEGQATTSALKTTIKTMQAEAQKLKAGSDSYRREITELKVANAKLSKKQADTTFIAKSEYDKLAKKLKKAEEELAKLKK